MLYLITSSNYLDNEAILMRLFDDFNSYLSNEIFPALKINCDISDSQFSSKSPMKLSGWKILSSLLLEIFNFCKGISRY